MPKGSPELTASRREEIVNACEKLYQTMSLKEMILQDLAILMFFVLVGYVLSEITQKEQCLQFKEK
ncbi:hypothetical protein [Ruminococcus albus]|uniref:Uncharacterized protein n=2 Tax=Ruminococcus TaxID=1263 RepID=E6UH59_RUMA7|nr:hypothetical protein [Ruminococcus albus]ADU22051.1 hypothetical protein Rumal_1550 [Ruminococcus albus 7 = DSM 20455]